MTLEPINQSFLPEDAPEKHARLWPRLGRAIRKDLGTACLEPTGHDKCCFSCIIHVVCNICNPLAGELTVSPMATFGRTPAAPPNGFNGKEARSSQQGVTRNQLACRSVHNPGSQAGLRASASTLLKAASFLIRCAPAYGRRWDTVLLLW